MKLFNSVQELWDYCLFCPVCDKNSRVLEVSVGPDKSFKLESFEKTSDSLDMNCIFSNRTKQIQYKLCYQINCLDNSFDVDILDDSNSWVIWRSDEAHVPPSKSQVASKVKEAYFYFYIQGSCQHCSSAHSADLELGLPEKKVFNIELERESFYLLKNRDKFHITLIHDRNKMLVSRCHKDDDGVLTESEKTITLPMVKLDFSNQIKVVDKIKTLILFS